MDTQKLTMLVVEDDENVVDELRRVFVERREKEPGFELMNVSSIDGYLELQKDHTFDVIITGMRIQDAQEEGGADEEGGLQVAQRYRIWNPGAVAIVYTAHPDLRQCVEVMRCGVWDYIGKNERDSIEKLVDSVEEGLKRRFSESGPSSSWLNHNLPKLVEQHGGEYVAFVDQSLVDSDHSLGRLRERVRKAYVDKTPLFLLVPEEY